MSSQTNIFPSNMALLQQKAKLKSATKGKDLLKRKADALKVQFRAILKDLIDKKKNLGNCYNDALIYLARANYSSQGDISRTVEENVKSKSDINLILRTKNHAGVVCPEFSLRNVEKERMGEDMDILGITGGGHTLNIAKKQFIEYITLIVSIASLQTSYKAIDETLKITNRRVNALEYIVIPRINNVMNYIFTELQERAKEDKFRIKKVLQNKKKHKEIELSHKEKGVEVKEAVQAFEVEEEEDDSEPLLF
jgi:V-type H+-transporting ATPase subunit D